MNYTSPADTLLQSENIFRKVCASNDVDPEYLPDLLTIFRFIHQHDKVETCLDKLEQSLQQYAATLADKTGLMINHDGHYHLASRNADYQKCYKVLSGFFYDWAQENGFKQKAKIIDALAPASFLNLLSTQTIFKDSTAMLNISHGMWSHTIQWFCIFEYQRQTNVLQHAPMSIYQQLGKTNPEIWNYLLDRMSVKFYNCPEFLTDSIISKTERWPLLSATLNRQKDKLLWGLTNRGAYHKHLLTKHDAKHTDNAVDGVVYRSIK